MNRYRGPLNDDGLCIDQRRWTTVSDLNPAIHTRCQLSVHGGGPCTLHNPSYDFNDDLIPLGGTFWVRLAEEWLAAQAKAA